MKSTVDLLADLARTFGEVMAAREAHDDAEALRLAESSVPDLRRIAASHPVVFGQAIELVGDLRSAASIVPDRGGMELHRESVLARLGTPAARSPEVGAAALKTARAARRLGDEAAEITALEWAAPCTDDFTSTRAREALAAREARRGNFDAALARLEGIVPCLPSQIDLHAGLLFGVGRFEDATATWALLRDDPFRANAMLNQAWTMHRGGRRAEAQKMLRPLTGALSLYLSPEARLAAAYLAALLAGEDASLPEGFDPNWGPVPRPESAEVSLDVFSAVRSFAVASVASELEQLAHGETVELARRHLVEAGYRRTAGEPHERAVYRPRLLSALRILDRELGPEHPETTPVLRELCLGEGLSDSRDERVEVGLRFLANIERRGPESEAAESAPSVASSVAYDLLETDAPRAAAVAERWLAWCLAAGQTPSLLAHTAAAVAKRRGHIPSAIASVRVAIGLLDPEDYDFVRQSFGWKHELVLLAREGVAPDAALEAELAETRAAWAAEWLDGLRTTSRERAVVPILEPYLWPGLRFVDVPMAVMREVADRLGETFLRSRVNARPTHRRILSACRPHEGVTSFAGRAGQGVEIESLETADTPKTRGAFASADDLRPLPEGRLSAWWD